MQKTNVIHRTFSRNFKILLERSGLHLDEVADAVGRSRSAVAKWHIGVREPSGYRLVLLATLFGANPADFYIADMRDD